MLERVIGWIHRQHQHPEASILELTPTPSDLVKRQILAEHDCCAIPPDAINVYVLQFKKYGMTLHDLTWRAVCQFDDDPLSGGAPEIQTVRLRIHPEHAAYLESIGLPLVRFTSFARASDWLKLNLRSGLE